MSCVYVIYSQSNKKCYIGSSREASADTRLQAHNGGKTKSTKSGRPWKIVHIEKYQTYSEARKRELFLKSGQGRKFLKNILAGEV